LNFDRNRKFKCSLKLFLRTNQLENEKVIFVDIFLQYRIALTWIYPAVKYAAYRPGDPNPQQELKKCDQPLENERIDDYCGKQKKLVKRVNNSPTRNTNQNFADDVVLKDRKKKRRKDLEKMLVVENAKDDFTQYLTERKLHEMGINNFKKSNSIKNLHTSCKLNQLVSIYSFDNRSVNLFFCRLNICRKRLKDHSNICSYSVRLYDNHSSPICLFKIE
jgi:hypothetical protein